eukprot:3070229-Rhodomonas_salina.3
MHNAAPRNSPTVSWESPTYWDTGGENAFGVTAVGFCSQRVQRAQKVERKLRGDPRLTESEG